MPEDNKSLKDSYEEHTNLEKIINKNISSMNEVHSNELRMSTNKLGVKEPTPVTIFNTIKKKRNKHVTIQEGLSVLFDSGSSHSMILQDLVLHQSWKRLRNPVGFESCNGAFNLTHKAEVMLSLPEINPHRVVNWQYYIDDRPTNELGYDMIIGCDLMTALGTTIDFESKMLCWEGAKLEMKEFSSKTPTRKEINAVLKKAAEPEVTKQATSRLVKILDSTYGKPDLQEVVKQAKHINSQQQSMLYDLLKKYEEIFDGELSEWDTEAVDFEFKEEAKPHSQRHFPVPHIHKETFRKELLRLVEIGVLEEVQSSEWGSPTFIIPKKDGKVRFISDFRKLNSRIKREQFPLPNIKDTLMELEGLQFGTILDLNMGYYHIELCPDSRKLCTIVFPFGKYEYLRLLMGLCNSPDIFQERLISYWKG